MTQLAEFDQLMADVTAGSEDAIWQLADTYTPYIIRAVRKSLSSQLRPKVDSEDFAQALWASLLLKRTDLTRLKTPQDLIAYLARATKNKVVDKMRQFHSQKYDVSREERLQEHMIGAGKSNNGAYAKPLYSRDPTPSANAHLRERWNTILLTASERDREILRLRLAGHTFNAVSDKLQIDEKTARLAMQKLISQLSA